MVTITYARHLARCDGYEAVLKSVRWTEIQVIKIDDLFLVSGGYTANGFSNSRPPAFTRVAIRAIESRLAPGIAI